jgi:hypothetical protein
VILTWIPQRFASRRWPNAGYLLSTLTVTSRSFARKLQACAVTLGDGNTHEFVRFVRESMAGGRVAPLPGRTDEPMNCSWRIGGTVEAEQLAAVGRWHQPLEAAQ